MLLGPSASGLGGAVTAIADDPTAMVYNPAALSSVVPAKKSLSYNAYTNAKYRIDGLLFGSAWEAEATYTPFFVGTTYRNDDLAAHWTFAAGVYDRGIYASRSRWKAAGTTTFPFDGNEQTIGGNYEVVSRVAGSVLTLGAAAARSTGFGSVGGAIGIRYKRESSQEFSRGRFGPIELEGADKPIYSGSIVNVDHVSSGYGLEPALGGMWRISDALVLGAMVSQVIYVRQTDDTTTDTQYSTTDTEGASTATQVGGDEVKSKLIESQDVESSDKPFGRPPFRYRVGASHRITPSTRWSADIIGRGYGVEGESEIHPGADAAVGIETLLRPTINMRVGAYTMWDPSHAISAKGLRRDPTYVDSLGLTSLAMYNAQGWSLGVGVAYQYGRGRLGEVDQAGKSMSLSMTTVSASFTSDQ